MKDNPPFHLLRVTPDDGAMGFAIEVNPEFEDWFLKAHSLSEWDEDKFQS